MCAIAYHRFLRKNIESWGSSRFVGGVMNRLAIIAVGTLLLGVTSSARADSITFGQFFQKDVSQRLFRYNNEDVGASKAAEIYTTSSTGSDALGWVPIFYNMSGNLLPRDLQGLQDAHLQVDFFSNAGTTGSGVSRQQLFGNGAITITRDTPALEGLNGRTNLLTVSFTDGRLDASQNNGSFTFKSTDGSVITYTSDFLDFSNAAEKDFFLLILRLQPSL